MLLERIDLAELEELVIEAWLARAPKRLATAYLASRDQTVAADRTEARRASSTGRLESGVPMATHRPVDPRASFPALEESVLERWRERDVFAQSIERRRGGPRWGFFEGPPTANGAPGSHHVLARVFKDIFPRYRTMCGYHVDRKGGWDCHGLPVELAVEKELGMNQKSDIEDYGIAEFNARCREIVLSHIDDWTR